MLVSAAILRALSSSWTSTSRMYMSVFRPGALNAPGRPLTWNAGGCFVEQALVAAASPRRGWTSDPGLPPPAIPSPHTPRLPDGHACKSPKFSG
jgi:hypothetical protein